MSENRWFERCIYVDDDGKVMLDVARFCAGVVMSYRPAPPDGFFGHGIGELLESREPPGEQTKESDPSPEKP